MLTIAGLLGHSVPGVTARYAHMPDLALVGAADRVAGLSPLAARELAAILPPPTFDAGPRRRDLDEDERE